MPPVDVNSKTAREIFSDAPPATTTRGKLIETALDLFYTHGFHAVGLDMILQKVGVTKTTFYNHFESRDQMIVEALAVREQWEDSKFTARLNQLAGDDPAAMLLAMFDVLDEWFNLDDYRGCLFILACTEFPSKNDPIHAEASKHFQIMTREVTAMAEGAGAANPAMIADQWALLLEGAVVRRHVHGDNAAAAKARLIAEAMLAQAIASED